MVAQRDDIGPGVQNFLRESGRDAAARRLQARHETLAVGIDALGEQAQLFGGRDELSS
jgi:hypothetical protein